MKTRMLFRSPNGAEGGGTAVAEVPAKAADPYMSASNKFKTAFSDLQQGGDGTGKGKAPEAKEPVVEKVEEAKPAKAAKAKPTALDVALETKPAEGKAEDVSDDDLSKPVDSPFKDLPETLPKDGKGDHWSKARAGGDRLTERANRQAAEIARLRGEVETAKSAPPDKLKELEETKAELNRYRDAMVEANIELDPKWRDEFVAGRHTKVEKAASKLHAFGGNGDALRDALQLKEGRQRNLAVKEAMGDLDEMDKAKVVALINEIDQLDDRADESRKNSQTEWERLKRERAADSEKQQAEKESFKRRIFDKVTSSHATEILPLRPVSEEVEDHAEWNGRIKDIIDKGYKLADPTTPPEEYAKAALWRYAGPIVQEIAINASRRVGELMTKIAEYEGAEPGFRGQKEGKTEERKSPTEKFHAAMAKLQGDA